MSRRKKSDRAKRERKRQIERERRDGGERKVIGRNEAAVVTPWSEWEKGPWHEAVRAKRLSHV